MLAASLYLFDILKEENVCISIFVYIWFFAEYKRFVQLLLEIFPFCLVTRAYAAYSNFEKIQWIYTASILHLDHFLFQSNKKCISFCQAN